MIKEIDNFLSDKECDYLIKIHNEYYDKFGKTHNKTEVLSLVHFLSNDVTEIKRLKYFYAKITAHIQSVDRYGFIDFFEVVKWKEKLNMIGHYDFDYHTWTSVIYLNDDYKGGETFIDNKIIVPSKGKIVTFQGPKVLHGVNKVLKGNRYTVPIWYMSANII